MRGQPTNELIDNFVWQRRRLKLDVGKLISAN